MEATYPKRLIEVDLPIKKISAHARREKSIRHGHISTLHIWWARRPLAACRAVLCAALWLDPVDEHCPQPFREVVARELTWFAEEAVQNRALAEHCDPETFQFWQRIARRDARLKAGDFNERMNLRHLLLAFIADFANWDNSTRSEYLAVSRKLTQAAHEALGGVPGTKPLVVDPFAGGGSIPLEALRIGADVFASDLNPVPVLLNKVLLEEVPRYGKRLADEVMKWGKWVKEQAEKELAEFYPKDSDQATPIAYLWARTVTCEGPGCGAEVPLMRSLWLCMKKSRLTAVRLIPNPQTKRVDFDVVEGGNHKDVMDGTVRRGAATCPACGYTTPVTSVRRQLSRRRGGGADARLFCVVVTRPGEHRRFYRLPNEHDLRAVHRATEELVRRSDSQPTSVPSEPTPRGGGSGAGRAFSQRHYGMDTFGDLFTPRQALALTTLARWVNEAGCVIKGGADSRFADAVQTCLALALDRLAERNSSLCRWRPQADQEKVENLFSRQALSMMWDFAEGTPLSGGTAGWDDAYEPPVRLIEALSGILPGEASVQGASATNHPLPDDAAQGFITDPPYYDAVPYSDLSDFFYVWLKRSLPHAMLAPFSSTLTPKDDECILDEVKGKDRAYFVRTMQQALQEGRRLLAPNGIGIVVFAHKSTAGWEAQLQAMVDAGWTVTGSWPLDTEMGTRLRARDSAALASSVHLVCRPRENPDGSIRENAIGDWRDVLTELPRRIHEWLPRLAREGVVGADAIFACLGPALEVFSRHSRVEKASGEQVTLREYLEYVWAAVAKEALAMVFSGADATAFEEDARLTAIWFWALKANGAEAEGESLEVSEEDPDEDAAEEVTGTSRKQKLTGYALPYDTARKLAQGLGADLGKLNRPGGIVTIKGNVATLNGIMGRENGLVGQQLALFRTEAPALSRRTRGQPRDPTAVMQPVQGRLEALFDQQPPTIHDPLKPVLPHLQVDSEPRSLMERLLNSGTTRLDRLHQAMLLFGRSQTSLIGPLLMETGVGQDQRFWQLAQALSALYPPSSDEKRWVDGVLARKKGLGF